MMRSDAERPEGKTYWSKT